MPCKAKADPTKVHEKQIEEARAQTPQQPIATEVSLDKFEELVMNAYTNKFQDLRACHKSYMRVKNPAP